jgi:hypothetical protein
MDDSESPHAGQPFLIILAANLGCPARDVYGI